MKPGGLATGAFRATGLAARAAFAYGPSTYWPLGAAFSLSLPRRTRAFGAGRLAAWGLAAPPALGFTRAAVVGMLESWLAAGDELASRRWLRYEITGECWKKHCGPSAGTTKRDIRLPAKKGSRD